MSGHSGEGYWSGYWARVARRRLGRRAFLKYLAAGAGTAGLALACREEAPQVETPAAPEVRPPAAGQGGTLVLHENGDPVSLDFYKTRSNGTMIVVSFVSPLRLMFTTGPDVGPLDYEIVPDLAAAMPEQPDATTYIFKLRPARWENKPPLNGRPLTAEDIVKNWERFRTEHPNRAVLANDVDRVEAVAPDTARFIMKRPLGPFVSHIGHHGVFYIMPYELFGTGQLEKDMWSAGPFIFKGYQVGSEIRYDYNPDYFVQGRPYLGGAIIRIVPDTATAQAQLRARQLDTTAYQVVVSAADYASLKAAIPDAVFVPFFRQTDFSMGMDMNDPVFRDKRVRQAISMAINRDELTRVSGEGQWVLPYGLMDKWYFDPRKNEFANARYYLYNPAEARALLRAAGVERLGPYDLITGNVFWPEQVQHTEAIQQQLRAVGIETNIRVLPFSEYYATAITRANWSNGFALGSRLVVSDPNETFTIFWDPDSPRLIAPGLGPILRQDTELLNAIERQRRELDFNRRRELVREVVNIMADRMYSIPLIGPRAYHVHQPYVQNLHWIFSYGMGSEYVPESFKTQ